MYIDDVMQETVGFLCIDHRVEGRIVRSPIGTCFFVSVFDDETKRTGTSYLVTAKHVWRDWFANGYSAYVRLNTDPPLPAGVYVVLPTEKGRWRFHLDDSVDLAVLPMRGLSNIDSAMHNTTDVQDIADTKSYLQQSNRPWPPGIGETLVYLGLLPEYAGHQRNRPIARFGHLALVPDEPIEGAFGPSHYYLAELQTYPGHSGGPVWALTHGQELTLLGVMAAGYPGAQRIISKSDSGEVLEQYVNPGVSLITPIERVVEILMTREMDRERKQTVPPPQSMKSIPTGSTPPDESFTKTDFLDALKKVSRKQSDEEQS